MKRALMWERSESSPSRLRLPKAPSAIRQCPAMQAKRGSVLPRAHALPRPLPESGGLKPGDAVTIAGGSLSKCALSGGCDSDPPFCCQAVTLREWDLRIVFVEVELLSQ